MTASLPLVYLCRHGQTDWNAEGRIQGQTDIPLNTLGRHQARRNGRYLKLTLGDRLAEFAFIASPLARTCETMRIIRKECGLDPDAFQTDDRLKELNFGDWQGRTLDEIERDEPGSLERRESDKWAFVPPGVTAESYEMLAKRAQPVFTALAGPSIIVAHGGITRIFLRLFSQMPGEDAAHAHIYQDRILKFQDNAVNWV